jgi:eukaryotic-like serine/threonine-protein kinase
MGPMNGDPAAAAKADQAPSSGRAEDFLPSSPEVALLGGRYHVREYLSAGATSRVYLADDTTGDFGRVVIKMLAPEVGHNVQYRSRMLREAHAVQPIDHPNVIRVFDVSDGSGGLPYVVMEALPGEPLGDRLRREGPLPGGLVLEIARQLAAGLQAVHAAGVVHRDVKPDNLYLIERDGEPLLLKILDFGMAKVLSSASSSSPTVLGTAAYMAPEQILAEPVDARSDVYSFGVVLFRMLTGHLPFETQVPADLLRHQLFSPIPPPSWLLEGIAAGIETVVLNATRKDPDNRYSSMAEVLADLTALQAGQAVAVRPLLHQPDGYEARTDEGRTAAEVLARRFGSYARVQEPRSRTRERQNDG